MLTALLDPLIEFVHALVGWLVDVAVTLEATPFSVAWPLLLVLLLQALLAAVSRVVWWARGAVWPINCGYPERTTGRGLCQNDVLGEWSRCRVYRRLVGSAEPAPMSLPIFADAKPSVMASRRNVTTRVVVAFFDSVPSASACCTTAAGPDYPRMWLVSCQ